MRSGCASKGGAPHGLRKPGEQEVPEGRVRAESIMRARAVHARADAGQRVPGLSVNEGGADHDRKGWNSDVTAQDGDNPKESPGDG